MTKLLVFFLSLFVIVTGCQTGSKAEERVVQKDYRRFWTENNYDGFLLEARFDECGEFGGHRETLRFERTNDEMWCIYSVFPYNCDSLDLYRVKLDMQPAKKVVKRTIKETDLREVNNYVSLLSLAWFERGSGSNAGRTFSAYSGEDSSFQISVYGDNPQNTHNYQKLLSALFP